MRFRFNPNTHYISLEPCPYDHVGLRYRRNALCVFCAKVKARKKHLRHRQKELNAQRAYRSLNKEKISNVKRNYRLLNKEKVREHKRNYSFMNKEKISLHKRDYYLSNKDEIASRKKNRCNAFPLKAKATYEVHVASKKGILIKQPCETCGSVEDIQAHHDSYYPNDWLRVRWLCTSCHRRWHSENKASYPS
jgi:hypothetical protein